MLKGEVCDILKKSHALGYSAIEIHTRENANLDLDKINKTCNDLNMKIAAIVTGRLHNEEGVTLVDDDIAKLNLAMNGLKEYVDMAQALNTNIIIGWIRGNIPDANDFNKYERRLAENISEVALYALERNVKVFIEAINRYEINFLNTGKEVMDFIVNYNIPNTYVHLDTFHMNIEEEDIFDTIKYCSSKLGYIHFADSNRKYPGAGHLDFNKILETLEEINYTGCISIECLPKPSGEEAAKMAIERITMF